MAKKCLKWLKKCLKWLKNLNLPQTTLFAVARGTGLKIPPQYLLLSPAEPSQLLPEAKKSKKVSMAWGFIL